MAPAPLPPPQASMSEAQRSSSNASPVDQNTPERKRLVLPGGVREKTSIVDGLGMSNVPFPEEASGLVDNSTGPTYLVPSSSVESSEARSPHGYSGRLRYDAMDNQRARLKPVTKAASFSVPEGQEKSVTTPRPLTSAPTKPIGLSSTNVFNVGWDGREGTDDAPGPQPRSKKSSRSGKKKKSKVDIDADMIKPEQIATTADDELRAASIPHIADDSKVSLTSPAAVSPSAVTGKTPIPQTFDPTGITLKPTDLEPTSTKTKAAGKRSSASRLKAADAPPSNTASSAAPSGKGNSRSKLKVPEEPIDNRKISVAVTTRNLYETLADIQAVDGGSQKKHDAIRSSQHKAGDIQVDSDGMNGDKPDGQVKLKGPAPDSGLSGVNSISFPSPKDGTVDEVNFGNPSGVVPPITPHRTPNRSVKGNPVSRGRHVSPYPQYQKTQAYPGPAGTHTPAFQPGDKGTGGSTAMAAPIPRDPLTEKHIADPPAVAHEGWQTTPTKVGGQRNSLQQRSQTSLRSQMSSHPRVGRPTSQDFSAHQRTTSRWSRDGVREESPRFETDKNGKQRWVYDEPRERPDYESSLFVAGLPAVSNIPESAYRFTIQDHFRLFDDKAGVKLIRDSYSHGMFANAFVMFETPQAADGVLDNPKAAIFRIPPSWKVFEYGGKKSILKQTTAVLRIEKAHGYRTLWINISGKRDPTAEQEEADRHLHRGARPVPKSVKVETFLEYFADDHGGIAKCRVKPRVNMEESSVHWEERMRENAKRAQSGFQELYGPDIPPVLLRAPNDEGESLEKLVKVFGAIDEFKRSTTGGGTGFQVAFADRENAMRACQQLRLLDGLQVMWLHEMQTSPLPPVQIDFVEQSLRPIHPPVQETSSSSEKQVIRRVASLQIVPANEPSSLPTPKRTSRRGLHPARSTSAMSASTPTETPGSVLLEDYPALPKSLPITTSVGSESLSAEQREREFAASGSAPEVTATTVSELSLANTMESLENQSNPIFMAQPEAVGATICDPSKERGPTTTPSVDRAVQASPSTRGVHDSHPDTVVKSDKLPYLPKVTVPPILNHPSPIGSHARTMIRISGIDRAKETEADVRKRFQAYGRTTAAQWDSSATADDREASIIVCFSSHEATLRAVAQENGKESFGQKQTVRFCNREGEDVQETQANVDVERAIEVILAGDVGPMRLRTPEPLALPPGVHDSIPVNSPVKLTPEDVRRMSGRERSNRSRSLSDPAGGGLVPLTKAGASGIKSDSDSIASATTVLPVHAVFTKQTERKGTNEADLGEGALDLVDMRTQVTPTVVAEQRESLEASMTAISPLAALSSYQAPAVGSAARSNAVSMFPSPGLDDYVKTLIYQVIANGPVGGMMDFPGGSEFSQAAISAGTRGSVAISPNTTEISSTGPVASFIMKAAPSNSPEHITPLLPMGSPIPSHTAESSNPSENVLAWSTASATTRVAAPSRSSLDVPPSTGVQLDTLPIALQNPDAMRSYIMSLLKHVQDGGTVDQDQILKYEPSSLGETVSDAAVPEHSAPQPQLDSVQSANSGPAHRPPPRRVTSSPALSMSSMTTREQAAHGTFGGVTPVEMFLSQHGGSLSGRTGFVAGRTDSPAHSVSGFSAPSLVHSHGTSLPPPMPHHLQPKLTHLADTPQWVMARAQYEALQNRLDPTAGPYVPPQHSHWVPPHTPSPSIESFHHHYQHGAYPVMEHYASMFPLANYAPQNLTNDRRDSVADVHFEDRDFGPLGYQPHMANYMTGPHSAEAYIPHHAGSVTISTRGPRPQPMLSSKTRSNPHLTTHNSTLTAQHSHGMHLQRTSAGHVVPPRHTGSNMTGPNMSELGVPNRFDHRHQRN